MALGLGTKGEAAFEQPIRQPRASTAGSPVLNVALYPWVPRPGQFQQAVTDAWNALGTGISLNFVDYDCYAGDPPADLDVYAFDTMYTSYLAASNFLQPIAPQTIDNIGDLQRFALQASQVDGIYYGIPYLGCGFHILYRAGDNAVGEALSMQALYQTFGNNFNLPGPAPQGAVQLLVDLSGGVTDASLYAMTEQAIPPDYSLTPPLPLYQSLDPNVLSNLWQVVDMAGQAQASYPDTGEDRMNWFLQGEGRAMVIFTELMSFFPPEALSNYQLSYLALAQRQPQQIYFTDSLGINPAIDPAMAPFALTLANLIASEAVMLASLQAEVPGGNPQYLIPIRINALNALALDFPLYASIASLMALLEPMPFQLGPTSRSWLAGNKSGIRAAILAGAESKQLRFAHKLEPLLDQARVPFPAKASFANIFRRG